MQITVKFTGLFRLLSGRDTEIIDISHSATINTLIDHLVEKYSKLPFKDSKTFYSKNEVVTDRDTELKNGDQVRIFQTLSGG